MCLCCNEDLKKISGDSWCFTALKQFFKGLVLQKHECTFIYRCTICRCKIYWNVHFTTARFLLGKHRSTRQFFFTETHFDTCPTMQTTCVKLWFNLPPHCLFGRLHGTSMRLHKQRKSGFPHGTKIQMYFFKHCQSYCGFLKHT